MLAFIMGRLRLISLWFTCTLLAGYLNDVRARRIDHILVSHNWRLEDWKNTTKYPPPHMTVNQQLYLHEFGKRGPAKRGHGRSAKFSGPRSRKELRVMTATERRALAFAFNQMKKTKIAGSQYTELETFVMQHRSAFSPGAHGGPSFLPWHREFLFRLEQALQHYDDSVTLPYLDTTLDYYLPTVTDSMLWTDELLGNANGSVKTGFAAHWNAVPEECATYTKDKDWKTLRRGMKPDTAYQMLSDDDIMALYKHRRFTDLYQPFETIHGTVHVVVGGHMDPLPCSPNDPVFFMHHVFVDCVWQGFRDSVQNTSVELEYPTSVDDDFSAYSMMKPFVPNYNIYGLSNHYTNYYYRCSTRPRVCSKQSHCKSEYIWCQVAENRCKAKVRVGGNCKGFPDEACHDGACPSKAHCCDDVCTCDSC